jgi:uncharacterized protein
MASGTTKRSMMNRLGIPFSFSDLFSPENRKATIILLLTPFLLTTFKYYGSVSFFLNEIAPGLVLEDPARIASYYAFAASLILLGAIPLLIVLFVFKEPLSSYGIQLGDWRYSVKSVLLLAPIMIALTYPSSKMTPFMAEYPLYKDAGSSGAMFMTHAVTYLLFYVGWEFYFRGFMQFGLQKRFGLWMAILIQTLASCLLHIGKPDGEIYGSILGGILWGVIVARSGSLLAALIIHWLLGVSLDAFIVYF